MTREADSYVVSIMELKTFNNSSVEIGFSPLLDNDTVMKICKHIKANIKGKFGEPTGFIKSTGGWIYPIVNVYVFKNFFLLETIKEDFHVLDFRFHSPKDMQKDIWYNARENVIDAVKETITSINKKDAENEILIQEGNMHIDEVGVGHVI